MVVRTNEDAVPYFRRITAAADILRKKEQEEPREYASAILEDLQQWVAANYPNEVDWCLKLAYAILRVKGKKYIDDLIVSDANCFGFLPDKDQEFAGLNVMPRGRICVESIGCRMRDIGTLCVTRAGFVYLSRNTTCDYDVMTGKHRRDFLDAYRDDIAGAAYVIRTMLPGLAGRVEAAIEAMERDAKEYEDRKNEENEKES